MISNYQRALDIAEVDETPRELVKQLHQYGLLMPDLPAPDRKGDWGPSWEGVVEAEPGHYAVRILIEGRQFRQSSQYARLFALALLAAANHAEAQANE